jgi:hypothetical protein
MIQITVTKSGIVSNQAEFDSQELADAWLSNHLGMGSFGSPRYEMQSVETSPAVLELQQVLIEAAVMEDLEVLDEQGASFDPPQFEQVEVSPAIYEEQEVEISAAVFEDQLVETNPEGYEIDIKDISTQIEQKAANEEALAYLAATDYIVIRAQERGEELSLEFKAERQAARDRIVK